MWPRRAGAGRVAKSEFLSLESGIVPSRAGVVTFLLFASCSWPEKMGCKGASLAALVAICGILVALEDPATYHIESLEEKRVSICSNMTGVASLLRNGFVHIPGLVSDADRAKLLANLGMLSNATQLVCGASDLQPEACMYDGQELWRIVPETMERIRGVLSAWSENGIVRALKMDRWGSLEVKGSEFISINGWKYPWSLLKGRWEFWMGEAFGMFSSSFPRPFHQIKGYITWATGIPIYSGYHGWHKDGPDQHGGRFHKMFLMLHKEGNTSAPEVLGHSNIQLLSRAMLKPIYKRTKDSYLVAALYTSRLLAASACTVEMRPGDAVFFLENTYHRTQDMDVSRRAMILDIQ